MDNPRDLPMASPWGDQFDDHRLDNDRLAESPRFEKIHRGDRAPLPVSSGRNADRMAKKTFGSRRVKKQISQKSGGIHRRRQKTVR